jgi:hypothetical protein
MADKRLSQSPQSIRGSAQDYTKFSKNPEDIAKTTDGPDPANGGAAALYEARNMGRTKDGQRDA